MSISRSEEGQLYVESPESLRILFMAPYAPDAPDYQMNPYTGDGTYPHYHHQVFERLRRLGFDVESSSKPYSIVHAGAIDYVFSLFNRMNIRNSEVFVSAYCEYVGLPYLGARPNIRAAAEDKYISKVLASSVGIPVPRGVPYQRGITPLTQPPFSGPYFVKNRFGAASEGITTKNVQDDWAGATALIESIWDEDTDAIVEQYATGIDVTIPVVGDETPRVLGVFEPVSDKPGHILTHDLKLTDHLGYRHVDLAEAWVYEDVANLWQAVGPIDYFRLDYRFDPATGERRFLEFNICCYIGEHGPFGLAAARGAMTIDMLMGHILAYSLLRQNWRRNDRQRIL